MRKRESITVPAPLVYPDENCFVLVRGEWRKGVVADMELTFMHGSRYWQYRVAVPGWKNMRHVADDTIRAASRDGGAKP